MHKSLRHHFMPHWSSQTCGLQKKVKLLFQNLHYFWGFTWIWTLQNRNAVIYWKLPSTKKFQYLCQWWCPDWSGDSERWQQAESGPHWLLGNSNQQFSGSPLVCFYQEQVQQMSLGNNMCPALNLPVALTVNVFYLKYLFCMFSSFICTIP